MATTSGVWNHPAAASQSLAGTSANPMASTSSSTSTSSTDSATISATDFLTLLVTELQNQDPTASTDPNEYVNQLVSVNSLEQLININQTLTTDLGSSSSTTTKAKSSSGVAAGTAAVVHSAVVKTSTPVSSTASVTQSSATSKGISGNFSVPGADPAAQRVANALNRRH